MSFGPFVFHGWSNLNRDVFFFSVGCWSFRLNEDTIFLFAFRKWTHARFNIFIFRWCWERGTKNDSMPKQLALSILLLSILIIMLSISFECTITIRAIERSGIEIDWWRTFGSFAIYHWPNKIRIWPHRIYIYMWQYISAFNLYSGSVFLVDIVDIYIYFHFNFAFVTIDVELNGMHKEHRKHSPESLAFAKFIRINVNHGEGCIWCLR